jgi:hypothetical protein
MPKQTLKTALVAVLCLIAAGATAQLREFDIMPVQSNRIPVFRDHLGSEPGHKMKSTSGWANNGNGSNASGFNGLFWSSSEGSSDFAWYRFLSNGFRDLPRYYVNESFGFSVRCLRD